RHELLDVPAVALGLPSDERAPEDTDDVAAFEQRQVERDGGDLAGGEADDQEPSFPRSRSQRQLAVWATHRVVDDVGSDTSGELADARLQIFGCVIDRLRRSVLAAQLELVVTRSAGDHGRTQERAELDGSQSHAAGSAH